MSLSAYKCYTCKVLPEGDVFICQNQHISCKECAVDSLKICRCKRDLKRTKNPLETLVKNVNYDCEYKSSGCTWKFNAKDLKDHLIECKYRPYKCIGNTMNVWICNWQGLKCSISDHFKTAHKSLGDFYEHSEEGYVTFKQDNISLITALNLISAFNKYFVFYYKSDGASKEIKMIIFLLGTKQVAAKYYYCLEILSPKNEFSKIKFTQCCYSDTDNINQIIDDGKCVSLPYNVVNNYVYKNSIHYRFRMLRKDSDDKSENMPIVVGNLAFVPKANEKRRNDSISSISSNTSNNNSKRPGYKKSLSESDKPSNLNMAIARKYSINKLDIPFSSPLESPSIHKNIFFEDLQRMKNPGDDLEDQLVDFNKQLRRKN